MVKHTKSKLLLLNAKIHFNESCYVNSEKSDYSRQFIDYS